jgi:hypothetical protein
MYDKKYKVSDLKSHAHSTRHLSLVTKKIPGSN